MKENAKPPPWYPQSEWEPEPLYLPLEPPPTLEPEEEDEDEKPSRVIIIPIASPDDAIRMC